MTLIGGAGSLSASNIVYKSYDYSSRTGASGTEYVGGFYDYSAADANLTNAATTVNFGTANNPYAAHAFIVSGGNGSTDGSDLVLTVSGTSIDDAGTRTPADSEVIEPTAAVSAANTYFETTKKWLGQVTFTLSSTGGTTFSYDFNYGLCKYEDFGNRSFKVDEFEATGFCNATDTGFDLRLLHHKTTGWTYSAAAFAPTPTVVAAQTTVHGTESDLTAGEQFAFKRTGLDELVDGIGSEGIIIEVTTSTNNAISAMTCHVGVNL
jgi:hypothetical protein